MLQIQNVRKKYGTNEVLQIPHLRLENSICRVKGANGSGKTTFLKMIAGLLSFYGDILINDINIKKQPVAYRQQVSWSEAEPLFPPFITGTDIIKLYCNIRKVSQEDADTLTTLFNMSNYISDAIGTYSAGMTKKLSLLLSFLGKSSLIILDEPLITLDPDAVITLCNYILEIHTKKNTGFLISSHQDMNNHLLPFSKELLVQNKTVTEI